MYFQVYVQPVQLRCLGWFLVSQSIEDFQFHIAQPNCMFLFFSVVFFLLFLLMFWCHGLRVPGRTDAEVVFNPPSSIGWD